MLQTAHYFFSRLIANTLSSITYQILLASPQRCPWGVAQQSLITRNWNGNRDMKCGKGTAAYAAARHLTSTRFISVSFIRFLTDSCEVFGLNLAQRPILFRIQVSLNVCPSAILYTSSLRQRNDDQLHEWRSCFQKLNMHKLITKLTRGAEIELESDGVHASSKLGSLYRSFTVLIQYWLTNCIRNDNDNMPNWLHSVWSANIFS
jgi:hypothetical protein